MATAVNDNQIDFVSPTGGWAQITHMGARRGNLFIGASILTTARTPTSGGNVYFAAGSMGFAIPTGEATGALAEDMIEEWVGTSGSLTISLHTGTPGTTGGNEATTTNCPGYARVNEPVADFTVAQ